ncbi:MAG: extracellular solute-binding protein [Castellaniella sp.]|uniref:extracellular solute-binding protein n=1 Tax=Castellaniella sp. TaxID=1955812 RepID=UPI002A36A6A2|nr:extracellular solute-binding protein [Castellaniella sp.]MDY0308516.1 extracellular solute-binding protein [Castellaniella sp.]
MNLPSGSGALRPGVRLVWALVAAFAVTPAWAATEVPVWHTLKGHNAEAFQDLIKAYNRSQSDVKVVARAFDTPEALDKALGAAAQSKNLPALAQIGDSHTLEDVARRSYVQPFHVLQKSSAMKNTRWFVSSDNAFVHDAKGQLMAFPYMLEIPVMYYNQDAFKKANLAPAVPQRTWMELQGQLVTMANNGSRQCPLTSDLPVSINLENLAAVNNQFYASADNGLKAKGLPSFSFDSTYVRHLSLMISWVRSQIMVRPDAGMHSIERFSKGECAVLMSSSSHIGEFNGQRKLNYAVSGLPYYPEVTRKPGNPFVSGSGLWVMKTPKPVTDATAAFLGWLSQPEQASRWYQQTGFLPLTQAAFDATPASYYAKLGQWRDLVAVYSGKAVLTAQGFRIHNYPAIRSRFQQILDSALSGQQPAVTALNMASTEANKLVRQR